jgi:hypothetical protein
MAGEVPELRKRDEDAHRYPLATTVMALTLTLTHGNLVLTVPNQPPLQPTPSPEP